MEGSRCSQEDVARLVRLHNLVYLDPVSNPLEGILLGNGDLGAVAWNDEGVRIRVGKNDVWDARFDKSEDPPIMPLSDFKQAVMEKGWTIDPGFNSSADLDAEKLARYAALPPSYAKPYPTPKPCGDIILRFRAWTRFELDLYDALLLIEGKELVAQVFISATSNIVAVRLKKSPKDFKLGLHRWRDKVSPEIPPPRLFMDDDYVVLEQSFPGDEEVEEFSYVMAAASPDKLRFLEGEEEIWLQPLSDSATVFISVFTSREGRDPLAGAKDLLGRALETGWDEMFRRHSRWWREFWAEGYVELDDKELEALWYRNLYYLACSSRKGKQCPGLFGNFILLDSLAWHGDYHYNYNVEQTFWAVYSSNRLQLAEPYYRFTLSFLPLARRVAREAWECEGAFYPHVVFPYQRTRFYFDNLWSRSLCLPAWAAQNFWWHYRYTMDKRFLREVAYPLIREVADFYACISSKCSPGELYPTVSPEHWGVARKFSRNRNCAVDIALAKFILRAAVEAAVTLGRDLDRVSKWRKALEKMPQYPTYGEEGEKVFVDVEGAPPIEYNIPVPATPVFPGEDPDVFASHRLLEIARRTVKNIRTNGNNSFIILGVARARLGFKDTYEWIRREALARARRNGTLGMNRLQPRNRFNEYGLYTEMYAFPMLVNEMLMQSWDGVIRLFPCIPRGLKARFKGLRSVGGFLVSSSFDGEKVGRTEVLSTAGGELRIVNCWGKVRVYEEGKTVNFREENGMLIIRTERGRKYIIEPCC